MTSKILPSIQPETKRLIKNIIQTRLSVSGVLFALACFGVFTRRNPILWIIAGYMFCFLSLAMFAAAGMEGKGKRYRALRDLIDLIAISVLVHLTGGFDSPWYLLAIFPLMSASRYFGKAWSWTIAIFSILAYAFAINAFGLGSWQNVCVFGLRACMFVGVALTASSLALARDREDAQLIDGFEKIDREILHDADVREVVNLILSTAIEVANSDLSALVLFDDSSKQETYLAWDTRKSGDGLKAASLEAASIVHRNCQHIKDSKKPLSLPAWHIYVESIFTGTKTKPPKWRARLVPLMLAERPIGVLGVFSRDRLHYYSENDVRRLSSMGSLIAIAQKNAKLYKKLATGNKQKTDRIQMLAEMSEYLKGDQGLEKVLPQVAKLICAELHSEEAAVFLPEDGDALLVKVALSGPGDTITSKLKQIECSFGSEQSFTRRVFNGEILFINKVAPAENYGEGYSQALPSGMVKHYMGAPLVIGNEVLGVIRVINRKADDYTLDNPRLFENGFSEEELQSLIMLAGKIAAVIRAAKVVERNRYFENLVDNSPDPIIVLDRMGRIEQFNRACEKLWGLKESEVLGKPVHDYYESVTMAREIGRALWKDKEHTIRDYRAKIKNFQGELIPILLSATLFVDREQRRIGSIGVFKDERAMIRLEEIKMHAEKLAAIRRMGQSVGHDIKTDLGTILNRLKILEERQTDIETQKICSAIREACDAATEKLRDHLLTEKTVSPMKQIISFNSILGDFKAGVEGQMSAAEIRLFASYPERDALVYVDPDQMRQVFSTLLSNSVDAIHLARLKNGGQTVGKINLRVEVQNSDVLLFWEDDGFGMTDEVRAKVFTPLFTTKLKGIGLGLFLSKNTLENHDGMIALESENNRGACFKITLPLVSPDYTQHSATGPKLSGADRDG
jgi:PAS domain S-box-containing protein